MYVHTCMYIRIYTVCMCVFVCVCVCVYKSGYKLCMLHIRFAMKTHDLKLKLFSKFTDEQSKKQGIRFHDGSHGRSS